MNDRQAYILQLLERFENKTASAEEVEILFEYLDDNALDPEIQASLMSRMQKYMPLQEDLDYWKNRLEGKQLAEKILALLPEKGNKPVVLQPRISFFRNFIRYAAAILLVLGPVTYFFFIQKGNDGQLASVSSKAPSAQIRDIAPGSNKAVLTLSDGSSIILDTTASGVVAEQAGTNVRKLADGRILYEYESEKNITAPLVLYNTMSTPRGGQYQLTLTDGTKVWLNAASSITFPTVFSEKERRVSVTGEVYFEVAKNPKKPFKVDINDKVEINVLGTHFNVNAYNDETSVNTTLIEGSLDVNVNGSSQRLNPGQQAQVRETNIRLVREINTQQVIAWKDGAFSFNKDNFDAVLRQISRWYDVEIVYEHGVPDRVFSGKMGRNLALSQILNFFKEIDVNLKIQGNKIIVMK